ncbi:MAG: hypothetical protein KIS72_04245 [Luteimonas sp.]|nr:hypothetical protein [Luteimonas sp.]
MSAQEIAVAAVDPIALEWIGAGRTGREAHWRALHGDAGLAGWLADLQPTHFHFGSEFCEHLLPSARTLRLALRRATAAALQFVLLTPVASPEVLRRLEALLPLLPEGTEVVVNDWGVGRLIAERFPACRITAGRILCRMVKDPRLAGPEWAQQCDHGLDSAPLMAVLRRIGVERLEIDLPLFAELDSLGRLPLPKAVHFPFFYIAKGRMCRPGSMSLARTERFAVGRRCRKECRNLAATASRPGRQDASTTLHVGNTLFCRHEEGAFGVLRKAWDARLVDRVVVPGEPL